MQTLPNVSGLDELGVIKDVPSVLLPPNAFSDCRNVRFKDGAVSKMKGEVNIFPTLFDPIQTAHIKYVLYWPNPNITRQNSGYFMYIMQENRKDETGYPVSTDPNDDVVARDIVYFSLPGGTPYEKGNFQAVSHDNGKWQHTFFQGGFALIINNGLDQPQYIIDGENNTNLQNDASTQALPNFETLPGWDTFETELTLLDVIADGDQTEFVAYQSIDEDVYDYLVYVSDALQESGFTVSISATTGNTVLTFGTAPAVDATVKLVARTKNTVSTTCGVIRSFGDFLVAGNLIESDSVTGSVVRNLTGVVRTSDVAAPGHIPVNWNPYEAGVSTADEIVLTETGIIKDMAELQGALYVYSSQSISALRLTGNAVVPIAASKVTNSYGVQATNNVLEFDGQHFVIGSNDIYLFGGHPGTIKSVADKKVRQYFYNTLNPLFDESFFSLRHVAENEIWICYPSKKSYDGNADRALIWNYRLNNWTIRDLHGVVSGTTGPLPGGGLPTLTTEFADGTVTGSQGIAELGAIEVRTIGVDADLECNGDMPHGQQEEYRLDIVPDVAAFDSNGVVVLDYVVGDAFDSGPSPQPQRSELIWNDANIDDLSVLALELEYIDGYIDATQSSTGSAITLDNTIVKITGANLGLSGAGTVTDFMTALHDAIVNPAIDEVKDALGWASAEGIIHHLEGHSSFVLYSRDSNNYNPQIIVSHKSITTTASGILWLVDADGNIIENSHYASVISPIQRGIGSAGSGSAPAELTLSFSNLQINADDTTTPVLTSEYTVVLPANLSVVNLTAFSYDEDADGVRTFRNDAAGTAYPQTTAGLTTALVDFLKSDTTLNKYFNIFQINAISEFTPIPEAEFVIAARAVNGQAVSGVTGITDYTYPRFSSMTAGFTTVVNGGALPDIEYTERNRYMDDTTPLIVTSDMQDATSPNFDNHAAGAQVGDYIFETQFELHPNDLTLHFDLELDLGDAVATNNAIVEYVTEYAGEGTVFEGDADNIVYEGTDADRMYDDLLPTWTRIQSGHEFSVDDFKPSYNSYPASTIRWRIRVPNGTNAITLDPTKNYLKAIHSSNAENSNGGNMDIAEGEFNRSGAVVGSQYDFSTNDSPPTITLVSGISTFEYSPSRVLLYDQAATGAADTDLIYDSTTTGTDDNDLFYSDTSLGSFVEAEDAENKIVETIVFTGTFEDTLNADNDVTSTVEHKMALAIRDAINQGALSRWWAAVDEERLENGVKIDAVRIVSIESASYYFRFANGSEDEGNAISRGSSQLTSDNFDLVLIQEGIEPVTGDEVSLPYLVIEGPNGFYDEHRLFNPNDDKNDKITAAQIINQIANKIQLHGGWVHNNADPGHPSGYTQYDSTDPYRLLSADANDSGDREYVIEEVPFTVTVAAYGNNGMSESNFVLDFKDSVNTEVMNDTFDVKLPTRDFRGRYSIFSMPTIILLTILDPTATNNTRILVFEYGDKGDYDPTTHTGTNGVYYTNLELASALESYIDDYVPEISATLTNNVIALRPATYDPESSNFLIQMYINNTQAATDIINTEIAKAESGEYSYHPYSYTRDEPTVNTQTRFFSNVDTEGNPTGIVEVMSIAAATAGSNQHTGGDPDSQANPVDGKTPSYSAYQLDTTKDFINISSDNELTFDLERPWPRTEVNHNEIYPIFAEKKGIGTEYSNKICAADIGWSIPAFSSAPRAEESSVDYRYTIITGNDEPTSYESYVERTMLPLGENYEVVKLNGLSVWLDGRTQAYYNGPFLKSRLNINVSGSKTVADIPDLIADGTGVGTTQSVYYSDQDYKVDFNTTARYLNFRLSDQLPDGEAEDPANPTLATADPVTYSSQCRWRVSGYQARMNTGHKDR